MRNFFLGILTVIILAGVGFAAYQYGQKSVTTPSVATPAQEAVTEAPTISPTLNDNMEIQAALYTKNNWPAGMVTVNVTFNDGTYAKGTSGGSGGGGYFYAVKVGGEWQIVADGNGIILCSDLIKYPNFPKTLIPECYDSTTQTIVKR